MLTLMVRSPNPLPHSLGLDVCLGDQGTPYLSSDELSAMGMSDARTRVIIE